MSYTIQLPTLQAVAPGGTSLPALAAGQRYTSTFWSTPFQSQDPLTPFGPFSFPRSSDSVDQVQGEHAVISRIVLPFVVSGGNNATGTPPATAFVTISVQCSGLVVFRQQFTETLAVEPGASSIGFANDIVTTDFVNPLEVYSPGGVTIGYTVSFDKAVLAAQWALLTGIAISGNAAGTFDVQTVDPAYITYDVYAGKT